MCWDIACVASTKLFPSGPMYITWSGFRARTSQDQSTKGGHSRLTCPAACSQSNHGVASEGSLGGGGSITAAPEGPDERSPVLRVPPTHFTSEQQVGHRAHHEFTRGPRQSQVCTHGVGVPMASTTATATNVTCTSYRLHTHHQHTQHSTSSSLSPSTQHSTSTTVVRLCSAPSRSSRSLW